MSEKKGRRHNMETMNGHVLWYEGGRLEELTNAPLHLCVGSVADGILSNEINLANLIRSGCVSGAHSLKVCDPLDGCSCKVSSLSCCCPPWPLQASRRVMSPGLGGDWSS